MDRRQISKSLAAIAGCALTANFFGEAQAMNDAERRAAEMRAKIESLFPFKRIEVPGDQALATWERLKREGKGCPVVLGGDESAMRIMEPFDPDWSYKGSVDDVLAAAAKLKMPEDLFARRKAEDDAAEEYTKNWLADPNAKLPTMIRTYDAERNITSTITQYTAPGGASLPPPDFGPNSRVLTPEETRAELLRERAEPLVGDWPEVAPASLGLSVATDIVSGKWLPKVQIAIVPTDDWTAIPAYLRYGNWNDCPKPEYHVATLRSWRDRYGVELIGLGADTMNLRAARRPNSRDEAIALAREQYAYCTDIVDQGTETLSNLAACLMADDWWYFWWD